MKKKLLSVLMAAAMVAVTAVPAFAADTIKIGVYEPASGDNGAGGKQETLGIQYANSLTPTVEIGGTEYNVELDIVDNESSNDKGPSAAAQLVSDGVSIVLGSYGSGVSIAASDIFKEGGVPAMGVTCTNPQVTQGNTHYFRICFLDPFQGTVLANFANENFEAKKAYVLTKLGDDYSTGVGFYFTKAFEALGGEVVAETFQEGNSDFTSYIASAKNAEADVFFAPVSIEAAALIIEQAAAQGLEMPLLASDTWDSNVVLNTAKGKNVQIYVTTFYQEGGNPEFDEGIKAYINSDSTAKANNGGDDIVAAVSAMGYDAYYVALEALKAAGSPDPAAVNEALWNVEYDGVCGKVVFDKENGDAVRDTAFVKSANTETGAWDLVGAQKVEE
ncbi:ABC transporter substrate-binding protein [Blautia sp. HCP3S3_G3]|uniref:ABC transporter substrate-binding protein n=1 Tax=Blautia sp. HCP3S3_G3 TaxID=3438913 RepID=UPI003F8CC013